MVFFLKGEKLQGANIPQIKLEVHDTYKNEEKITTNFKVDEDEDVINKGFLHEKVIKMNRHLSQLENEYKEFKLQYNK